MLTAVRETFGLLGMLWTDFARVLRARFARLLLLFLIGWAGYFITIGAAGMLATRWAWIVIPLMGAGCLIQLTVTLAAYRLVIRQAEVTIGRPLLPPLRLIALVSGLLIPFAGVYSVFGYFKQYAHDAMYAAATMSGGIGFVSFLIAVDPMQSVLTLLIVLAVFGLLWLAHKLLENWTANKDSVFWTLLTSFVSACMVFLAVFSLFRFYTELSAWITNRNLMAWKDQVVAWVSGLVHFEPPAFLTAIWQWVSAQAWPVFWYVFCRPILWLTVVSLVGGMKFTKVDSLWDSLRRRIGFHGDEKLAASLVEHAPGFLVDPLNGLLRFLHMLVVVLKSGVPFLAAMILSFTVVDKIGDWLTYLLVKSVGPLTPAYAMMVNPALKLIDMVVVPLIEAVLLAVAYVHLRQVDAGLTLSRPAKWSVGSLLALLVSLALAIGVTQINPGERNEIHQVALQDPVTLLDATVTIEQVRAARAIHGDILYVDGDATVDSLGVFVAVRVSLASAQTATMIVLAQIGDQTHATWHDQQTIRTEAGFRTSQDFVFEIPEQSLPDFQIRVLPGYVLSSADRVFEARNGALGSVFLDNANNLWTDFVTPIGVFSPPTISVEDLMMVDEVARSAVI